MGANLSADADVFVIATGGVSILITTPVAVMALYLVVRLRNVFPLTGRDVRILVALWVGITCATLFSPLSSIFETSCYLNLIFDVNVQSIGVNAVLVMLLRLWFLYFAAQQQLKKYINPKKPYSTWFAERRHYASPRFVWRFYLALTLSEILLADAVFMFAPVGPSLTGEADAPGCESLNSSILISNVILVVTFVMVIVTGWRIRNIRDGYYMKQELKYMIGCGALFITGLVIEGSVPVSVHIAVRTLSFLFAYCNNYLFPVWLAIREQRARAKRRARRMKRERKERKLGNGGGGKAGGGGGGVTNSSKGSSGGSSVSDSTGFSLRDILTNDMYDDLREDFANHLAKEFSTENLLFWNETLAFYTQYEDRTDRESMVHAVRIYRDYVDDAAPFQANLNGIVRLNITEAVSRCPKALLAGDYSATSVVDFKLERDMFEEARESVYVLMARDSYVRWSAKRRRMLQDAKEETEAAETPKPSTAASSGCRKVCSISKRGRSVCGGKSKSRITCTDSEGSRSHATGSEYSTGSSSDTVSSNLNAHAFLDADVSDKLESAGTFKKKDAIEAFSLAGSPSRNRSPGPLSAAADNGSRSSTPLPPADLREPLPMVFRSAENVMGISMKRSSHGDAYHVTTPSQTRPKSLSHASGGSARRLLLNNPGGMQSRGNSLRFGAAANSSQPSTLSRSVAARASHHIRRGAAGGGGGAAAASFSPSAALPPLPNSNAHSLPARHSELASRLSDRLSEEFALKDATHRSDRSDKQQRRGSVQRDANEKRRGSTPRALNGQQRSSILELVRDSAGSGSGSGSNIGRHSRTSNVGSSLTPRSRRVRQVVVDIQTPPKSPGRKAVTVGRKHTRSSAVANYQRVAATDGYADRLAQSEVV